MQANSSENGMVIATIRAARTFPRNTNRTTVTRTKPSARLCNTVSVVKCTRSLRSISGLTVTPGGRM